MASELQIEANRKNAQRSTGPKTDKGKERCRRNAFKHGLAGEGVVLTVEEAEAVDRREAEFNSSFKPYNALEVWLNRQFALESVRLEVAQSHELTIRIVESAAAVDAWDLDRAAETEALAARLASEPARIASALRRTKAGTLWLLERCRGLADALRAGETLDEARRARLLDLLGRDEADRVTFRPISDPACALALLDDQIARLEAARDGALNDRDEREQAAAALGKPHEISRSLGLARRYISATSRRLQWLKSQFKIGRHDYTPGSPDTSGRVWDRESVDSPAFRPPSPPASRPPTLLNEQECRAVLLESLARKAAAPQATTEVALSPLMVDLEPDEAFDPELEALFGPATMPAALSLDVGRSNRRTRRAALARERRRSRRA